MLCRFAIGALIALALPAGECTFARENDTDRHFEVKKIAFVGNKAIDSDVLLDVLFTKQSPGAISKFFYRLFGERLGSPPKFFDEPTFRDDLDLLRRYYQDHGYFDVEIRDSVFIDTTGGIARLTIHIAENRPSRVERIEYRGLGELAPGVLAAVLRGSFVSEWMIYEKQKVNEEVNRVLGQLANVGYPAAQFDRENSVATRFLSTGNFHLTFAFQLGKQYEFGETSIIVSPPRRDITHRIVIRQLEFKPGDIYSREKKAASERNLNRLGIFESARIDANVTPDLDTSTVVPVEVVVRPRDKHEVNPELSISDENNAFNFGMGIGYVNRNFFGDARIFNARVRLRTQSIFDWNFRNVFGREGLRDTSVLGGAELQFQVAQPYLFTRSLSGTWMFSLSAEKQKFYILPIIRNRIGLTNQFTRTTSGFADWTLERVSVEFVPADTAGLPVDLGRRREEERPQFNSILTLTLQRDKTNDIFSPSAGFFHSISAEESGVLPLLFKNIQPDLPFTQFYKFTAYGRWYRDLSRTRYNILAVKVRAGYQDKYGSSKGDSTRLIPLNRRFFAGGSGSVRGWKSRDLGAMPRELLQFGGNALFETSVEMRINYFRNYGKLWFVNLDNIWAVYFIDAGNVWHDLHAVRGSDLAIAAGIGFRYETLFGPFRIDFGLRVYDPKEQAGRKWLVQKRFFPEVLSEGVLHFGVGHAF